MSFSGSMEAKEFLVSRIAAEASRRRVVLSELERKMLYFSEGYPTLPDMMEVNEKFEAEYNDEKYEEKIKKLSREAFERDRKETPENVELWREAIKVLKKEDHYILVMLDVPSEATIPTSSRDFEPKLFGLDVPRPTMDLARLILAGLALTAVLIGAIAALYWAGQNVHLRLPDYVKWLAFFLAFALGCYLTFSEKGRKVGDWLDDVVDRMARWF